MLTNEDLDRIEKGTLYMGLTIMPFPMSDVRRLVKMARLELLCRDKFASGNGVPVERITIKREEFEAIAGERG